MGARLRASAALSAAAFALHQLRYVGADDETARAAASAGHGYLTVVAPVLALLCALALAQLAVVWQRRGRPGRRVELSRLWIAASTSLLTVYTCQELLESLLSADRTVATLAGGGGWIALPLAAALGLLVALLIRGAEALLAGHRNTPCAFALPRNIARPRTQVWLAVPRGIGRNLASRAPPLAG